jgi:hypothetical protein
MSNLSTNRSRIKMSQYNRKQFNTSKSASNEVKKFCKVCQDAGKPESMYTSHFVRDRPGPDGKVVCPTLLSQNCRGCGKSGHTYKYCKLIIQEKKQQDKWEENEKKWKSAEKKLEESVKRPSVPQKKETVIKVLGAYASIILSSSSDEDSDDDDEPKAKAAHPKTTSNSFKNGRVRFMEDDEPEKTPIVAEKPIVELNPDSYAARLKRPKPVSPPPTEEVVIQEQEPEKPIGFKIVSLPKSAPKPVRQEESLVAPRVLTEEEKQKLKEKIKTIQTVVKTAMAKPCKWDEESSDDDDESDNEEKEKTLQCIATHIELKKKEEQPVKTNVFIELKDAWSDDEA